jgi:hypothetical protein
MRCLPKKNEKKPRVSRDINSIIFHRFLFRFSLSNSNPLSCTNKSNFPGIFYCRFRIDFKIGLPDVLLLEDKSSFFSLVLPIVLPKKFFSKEFLPLKMTYFTFVLLFGKFLLKSPPF